MTRKIFLCIIFLIYFINTSSAIIDSKYDFDSKYEIVGQPPSDVYQIQNTGVDSFVDVNNTVIISGNNSINFYDNDAALLLTLRIVTQANYSSYYNPISSGFANFSINVTATDRLTVELLNVSRQMAYLRFESGTLYAYNGSVYTTLSSFSNKKVYNVSIRTNGSNNSYAVFLNNTQVGGEQAYINNVTDGFFQMKISSSGASFRPRAFFDNIIFEDLKLPTQSPILRKFPYPYQAMLTISDDTDDMSASELYSYLDYFNTNKNTTNMGQGIDLEMGQNFYVDGDGLRYYKYNNHGDYILHNTSDIFLDYLKTGYFDSFHSMSSRAWNMSNATQAQWLNDTYDNIFLANDVQITSWINHGGKEHNFNASNLDGSAASVNYKGDDPTNATYYHLPITKTKTGILYEWEGTYIPSVYQNYPIAPQTMGDGEMLFRIQRKNTGVSSEYDGMTNRNFSKQIQDSNLKRLVRRNGYSIITNHLFYDTAGQQEMNPMFDDAAIQNLTNLKNNYSTNQIYVTSIPKTLLYAEVYEYLNFTYDPTTNIVNIYNVTSSVRDFTPTTAELAGITIYINGNVKPTVRIQGVDYSSSTILNNPDSTGNYSVMFPLIRNTNYPYPNISSVGTYRIYSDGTTIWDWNTTRPALNQRVNFSILPSSDSLNVTLLLWDSNRKIWIENATNSSITSLHVIGDLPISTDINVKVDNVLSAIIKTNNTGYISFIYTGGYSNHTFDLSVHTLQESIQTSKAQTCSGINNYIIVAIPIFGLALMIFAIMFIFIQIKGMQSGESQVNPLSIILSIFTVIIGFALLVVGNYLVYTIVSVTGC